MRMGALGSASQCQTSCWLTRASRTIKNRKDRLWLLEKVWEQETGAILRWHVVDLGNLDVDSFPQMTIDIRYICTWAYAIGSATNRLDYLVPSKS